MKLSRLTFATIFSSFLFLSCTNTANESENENIETTETSTEENHHHDENEAIVLNNGEKWIVVPEMMAFIKNIENGVIDFSSKENPSFEDHQQLSILIEDNLGKLTSSCTMTGQGHDELHKWLLPFLDLSTQYSECENLEQAEEIYQIINDSFKELNTNFK